MRLETTDFLKILPLNEVGKVIKGAVKDFTPEGVCFTSEMEWQKGQVLLIDYFISDEGDSVQLKIVVIWSELIDSKSGYFCGGRIIHMEDDKAEKFSSYYLRKLKERSA